MAWLWSGLLDPLVAVRAIHFAATAIVAGALLFRIGVAEPVLRRAPVAVDDVRARMRWIVGCALAVAVVSGVIWLGLEAAAMSGRTLTDAMTADVLVKVATDTQFGLVGEIRAALALVLVGCLVCDRFSFARWLATVAGLALVAAIAWTGHAGATTGAEGVVHLAADVLHLIAASAWVGGLLPLAVLLAAARGRPGEAWARVVRDSVGRFSTLGLTSVSVLIVSGLVNSLILVGSLEALRVTQYGLVLIVKLMVFALMLAFAAVNRVRLTPRLAFAGAPSADALQQLTRNSVIEIVLGYVVFILVGLLGTLHPAIHLMV